METYEIRQINAIYYDTGWTWNNSIAIGSLSTQGNAHRALTRALAKMGIRFRCGTTRIVDDWPIIEIQDRKTGEPLFAAIIENGGVEK